LYCDAKENLRRRVIQTVLFQILFNYLIVLAPIIPHTAEEVYEHLTVKEKKESIHLET
jgi:isoleucyl-tRNA synthetase